MSGAPFREEPDAILARLAGLRAHDAPTHGGHILSYVYDPGDDALDELAAAAIRAMQPVNGLDPTTFGSVAALERDLIAFARDLLHGDDEVVGSVTTGGTESCLLAVKTARDVWRAAHPELAAHGMPRLVAPATVHAAFRKAAHYLDVRLDVVPVDRDGRVAAAEIEARLGDDVALVVVSAPSYPVAALDPVEAVAAACAARGIALHVDACIGGLVLPFWPGLPTWDFAVPGVTSVSADLHKYGYAPKGASVLLQRGRDRQRAQYFATTRWPGYPVVNPTVLGSKSAGPLAAAWAIVQALGIDGLAALTDACRRATDAVRGAIDGIEGLRVVGEPVGPLLAVATDEAVPSERRVDPHHWADAVRSSGWVLQLQPGLTQADGVRLPPTTHLTITPVTERGLPSLLPALVAGADAVRGVPPVDPAEVLAALPPIEALGAGPLDSETAAGILTALGVGGSGAALPDRQAPLLALIEAVPPELAERLLIELLGRLVDP